MRDSPLVCGRRHATYIVSFEQELNHSCTTSVVFRPPLNVDIIDKVLDHLLAWSRIELSNSRAEHCRPKECITGASTDWKSHVAARRKNITKRVRYPNE